MKLIILPIILIGIAKVNCGFFDGMNVGLSVPAMQIKVPSPGMPKIKIDAQVKMPPKQSLKSLLPKFRYNIPTFADEHYPTDHWASSASNNEQNVVVVPNPQSDRLENHLSNYRLNRQPMNDHIEHQPKNQINKYMSNQMNHQMNHPNNRQRNYQMSNSINHMNNQASQEMNYQINQKLNNLMNYQASDRFNKFVDTTHQSNRVSNSQDRYNILQHQPNYPAFDNHRSQRNRMQSRASQFEKPYQMRASTVRN